jgi:hypothetical protein
LRNGDGGDERFLGRRRVRWIALEQNLAADAMGVGFIPALAGAFRQGNGAIDARERCLDLARFCFCQSRLKERCKDDVGCPCRGKRRCRGALRRGRPPARPDATAPKGARNAP